MATVISYGVKPGAAGPRAELRTGSPAGPPPVFGTVAWVGAFPWGPVNKVMVHENRQRFSDWHGPWTLEDEAARAVSRAYDEAGSLIRTCPLRIADGEELQAAIPIHNREQSQSTLLRVPTSTQQVKVGELRGAFPGERGGRAFVYAVEVADLPAAISGQTLDIGTDPDGNNWPLNRFKGGELRLPDGQGFHITGSSVAGVLTLARIPVTSDTGAQVVTVTLESGRFDGLAFDAGVEQELEIAASVKQDDGLPTSRVRLTAHVDGGTGAALDLPGLGYAADVNPQTITQNLRDRDDANPWVEWVDLFGTTGLDDTEANLPADWAGLMAIEDGSEVSGTYKVRWWTWARTGVDDGGAYVADLTGQDGVTECTITCTFTDATNFDVEIVNANGIKVTKDLPAGVLATEYDLGFAAFPAFTLRAGDTAMDADDTIVINVRPVPEARAGARLFPAAYANQSDETFDSEEIYVVIATTFDSITVAPGAAAQCDASMRAPGAPEKEGTVAPTYDLNTTTFKWFDHDGDDVLPTAERTITGTADGLSAAAAVAHLNGLLAAEYGAGVPQEIEFFVIEEGANAGNVGVRATENAGEEASLKITDGTANAVLGFTNDETLTGVDGKVLRLECPRAFRGGFDGLHGLVAQDWIDALNPNGGSPLDALNTQDLGLVHLACPGQTDVGVSNAAGVYTEARGYMAVVEPPRNLADEIAVAKWRRDNLNPTRTIYPIWPSHELRAYSPMKPNATVEDSLLGAFLGMKAREANANKGYHRAMANFPAGAMRSVNVLPTDSAGGTRSDDARLNRAGVVPIWHIGPNVYAFGDEAPDQGGGTVWIHKMETILLIGRMLHDLASQFAYQPIPEVWSRVRLYCENRLRPLFNAGAFKAAEFADAVQITVGRTNNPEIVQNAGQVIADVRVRGIVDTAKTVLFVVTTDSVAVAIV